MNYKYTNDTIHIRDTINTNLYINISSNDINNIKIINITNYILIHLKQRSHLAILLQNRRDRIMHTILQQNNYQNRSDFGGVCTPSKHFCLRFVAMFTTSKHSI